MLFYILTKEAEEEIASLKKRLGYLKRKVDDCEGYWLYEAGRRKEVEETIISGHVSLTEDLEKKRSVSQIALFADKYLVKIFSKRKAEAGSKDPHHYVFLDKNGGVWEKIITKDKNGMVWERKYEFTITKNNHCFLVGSTEQCLEYLAEMLTPTLFLEKIEPKVTLGNRLVFILKKEHLHYYVTGEVVELIKGGSS